MQAINVYFRNVKRSKLSFAINLIGLSTGLACVFLIFLWVKDETSVDKFHQLNDRLYQMMISRKIDGNFQTKSNTPAPLIEDLLAKIRGIENGVATAQSSKLNTISIEDNVFQAKGLYTRQSFFDIFSFELLKGTRANLLTDKYNIVLSEELAGKLFGNTDNVVGKYVQFDKGDEYRVSGIMDKVPSNSTLNFDFVLPLDLYEQHTGLELSWGEHVAATYVVLDQNTTLDQLNNRIIDYLVKDNVNVKETVIFARLFSDGYLYGNYENGVQKGGRIEYVRLFIIIGLVILLIACINFISLSTAIASDRTKEVGVKKALGADKKSLIFQYLGESVLMAFLSLIMAILIIVLVLPSFNELAEKQISLSFDPEIIFVFLLITFLTGVLSGIYPAFFLSAFKPVEILKSSNTSLGGQWIRKALVISQFIVSIILIIFTVVIYNQFSMIQNRNLGYDKDNVIYFDMNGELVRHRESFLSEIKNISGVIEASSIFVMKDGFLGEDQATNAINWPGRDPDQRIVMDYRVVDYNLIELLNMNIIQGRSFSRDFKSDMYEVVLNQTAVDMIGYENPVGETIEIWGGDKAIVGVVEDFSKSIHEGNVKPMFLIRMANTESFGALNNIMVKVDGQNLEQTLSSIQNFHSEFNPGFPLSYNFLDQDFQGKFTSERRLSVLSRYFAGLAIVISCLGLFGLTAFTINKRKKEISIRMVLGSGRLRIILLLYQDIIKLAIVALLIGIPVSYFLAKSWLESFAVRIDIEPWFFILAALLFIVLILVASGLQAFKALSINPAETLRKER